MKHAVRTAIIVAIALLGGCAGSHRTVFLHPEYNFGAIERIAVIPFNNLSKDQGMGEYMSRLFVTELLATHAFDVVETGEVVHALTEAGKTRSAELSTEEIKDLAAKLGVQAFVFGAVGESSAARSGNATSHVVSLQIDMVETELGVAVWSASIQSSGPGFISRLLGIGEQTRSDAARKVVKKAVKTLVR